MIFASTLPVAGQPGQGPCPLFGRICAILTKPMACGYISVMTEMTIKNPAVMQKVTAVLRALADESRARIILALRGQPMCVCQIVEMLRLANSTVSEHLTILKEAGLLTARKDGRWVYYRLSDNGSDGVVDEAVAYLLRVLENDRQIRQDAKQLAKILQIDPGELCRRQKSAGGKCCGR